LIYENDLTFQKTSASISHKYFPKSGWLLMNTAFELPTVLSPQASHEVCGLAWYCATSGGKSLPGARGIAERWLNKGGDIHQRATHFLLRESLYVAGLSASTAICGWVLFALLVRQLHLLAVMQYLSGQDLRQEATQYRALEALYDAGASALPVRWHSRGLCNMVSDYRRTYRTAQLFHRQYVAPVFPPLEPLR
jgi:hypothetical protein